MEDNITAQDLSPVIRHLKDRNAILTQSKNVAAFEQEWSRWIGLKHSVFVNSGASANLVTMAALRELYGAGEVIVPTLTWVSDISSVLYCGFDPVFVDINPRTLGMDTDEVLSKITSRTKAVFLTHILGFNALDDKLIGDLKRRGIPLIEDACESHGATFKGQKVGRFGLASNFSFYYAHHMSTIEGGMVSTNDDELFESLRMFRSHGMVRESTSDDLKARYKREHPDLNPDFIFAFPAFNVRSTELNAIIGRSQLKRLDRNNKLRQKNFRLFLDLLDPEKYQTNFAEKGSCNYAFTLVLKKADDALMDRVMSTLREIKVEFRRGTSGGGNQLRQPYLRKRFPSIKPERYENVDHVHFYGMYIGNYPSLPAAKIRRLCEILNAIPA